MSIQGEGYYTGKKMVFVRTEYCNLRCSWCDTKYSFNEGRDMSVTEIVDTVNSIAGNGVSWVCLTGGEPLLQRDVSQLVRKLSEKYSILLETSGSLDIKRFLPDYASVRKDIDFKLPSSGMYRKFNDLNLEYMDENDYIKFVVNDKYDFSVALQEMKSMDKGTGIVIQPVYGTEIKWLAEEFLEKAPGNARLMLQEHKYIYGDIRGV
ncbi:MAG: radical SAM protein [Ferroplasma sp.]|uniref:7-carboxy-7-deazaguanine synthase QueE n=1 Tax=Ferroplasma sp. TaxID=2591003 RepID=UPI002814AFC9|nr:radical SAM protein [Ferroplasma sp.]WMT50463.1 MAG: radical SAM protein [Ferroplasma sp.]